MCRRGQLLRARPYRECVHSSRTFWVVAAVSLLVTACSGSDSADEAATTEPTTTLSDAEILDGAFTETASGSSGGAAGSEPRCPVDAVPRESDWPFGVVSSIIPSEYVVDDLTYIVRGVTDDVDTAVGDTMERAFLGFDVDEPTGDATTIRFDLTDPDGEVTAVAEFEDPDGDDCWDAVITATFTAFPPPGETTADPTLEEELGPVSVDPDEDPIDADGTDPTGDPDDDADSGVVDPDEDPPSTTQPDAPPRSTLPPLELDELARVGGGDVITFRGRFPIVITECELAPVSVLGLAREGEVELIQNEVGDPVSVTWTYLEGVVIFDEDANVLALTESSGHFVADGEGPEGPETVIVEFVCESTS